jgi:hypothetical protein
VSGVTLASSNQWKLASEGGLRDALKSHNAVEGKAMADKKDRERVIAEITLSHLMRQGTNKTAL